MGSSGKNTSKNPTTKKKSGPLSGFPLAMVVFIVAGLYVSNVPFKHTWHAIRQFINDAPPIATPFLDGFMRINDILLVSHMMAALPCIIIGPFLFYRGLQKANPKLHRTLGKAYVYGVLYSAVTVIPLAMSKANVIPQTGFTVMAVLWFCVTWLGFMAARNKDFIAHRRWMMRSYAMSFAFVHVNLTYHLIGVYDGALDPVSIKVMQSMVSWLFNLFVVEIYLSTTTFKGKFVGWTQLMKNIFWWQSEDKFFLRPPRTIEKKAA